MIKNSVLLSLCVGPILTLLKETKKEQAVMDNFFGK